MVDKTLIDALNDISFSAVEKTRLGYSLYIAGNVEYSDMANKMSINELFNEPITGEGYKIDYRKGKILFSFPMGHRPRLDHKKYFMNVTRIINDRDVLFPIQTPYYNNFNAKEKKLIIKWVVQMRHVPCNYKQKLIYANLLMCALRRHCEQKKYIDKYKYKVYVSNYDLYLEENITVEYCKKNGIVTVTLCHGILNPYDKIQRLDFTYSISDFLVVHSDYLKNIIINEGLDGNKKIVALGMHHIAGLPAPLHREKKKNERAFLLCLDGNRSLDVKMIKICAAFAEKNNYFLDIKPHPFVNNTQLYMEFANDKCSWVGGNIDEKMLEKYSFAVACSSTVKWQLLYLLTPTVIFQDEDRNILTLDLPCFYDVNSFTDAVSSALKMDEKELATIRSYMCGCEDVNRNYKLFFEDLVIEGNYNDF